MKKIFEYGKFGFYFRLIFALFNVLVIAMLCIYKLETSTLSIIAQLIGQLSLLNNLIKEKNRREPSTNLTYKLLVFIFCFIVLFYEISLFTDFIFGIENPNFELNVKIILIALVLLLHIFLTLLFCIRELYIQKIYDKLEPLANGYVY